MTSKTRQKDTSDELPEFVQFLAEHMDKRFNALDERFNAAERRFDAIDDRFDKLEFLMTAHDRRITILEDRMRLVATKVGLDFRKSA